MRALLKWKGDELFLGATKMAEVRLDTQAHDAEMWRYVLGPDSFVSEPYQEKEDARQDAEAHVRRQLKGVGVADA